MNYEEATKRFDLRKTIANLEDLDYAEIMDRLREDIKNSEKIRLSVKTTSDKDLESLRLKYIEELKGLVFFINNGTKPIGVDEDSFMEYKTITEKLIEKKILKKSILKAFQ